MAVSFDFFGCGRGIRTPDLRVMSPTSYQTAPSRGTRQENSILPKKCQAKNCPVAVNIGSFSSPRNKCLRLLLTRDKTFDLLFFFNQLLHRFRSGGIGIRSQPDPVPESFLAQVGLNHKGSKTFIE